MGAGGWTDIGGAAAIGVLILPDELKGVGGFFEIGGNGLGDAGVLILPDELKGVGGFFEIGGNGLGDAAAFWTGVGAFKDNGGAAAIGGVAAIFDFRGNPGLGDAAAV